MPPRLDVKKSDTRMLHDLEPLRHLSHCPGAAWTTIGNNAHACTSAAWHQRSADTAQATLRPRNL